MAEPTTASEHDPSTESATTVSHSSSASLPWALVALLSALSLILATLLFVKTDELNKLRAQNSQTQTSTPTAGGQPGGKQDNPAAPKLTAAPTTGGNAPQLLNLARRKADDPLALGKPDAPIAVIEWADYRCPFCAKWSLEVLPQLKPYIDSGSLRVEYRDLVIFGEQSQAAHAAARAAGNQGKYWEYANALWAVHTGQGHPEMTGALFTSIAQKVGISDMAKFEADRTSVEIEAAIKADSTEAQQLGLSSTPFFLVNTTPISGALPAESFINLIEQYGGKK